MDNIRNLSYFDQPYSKFDIFMSKIYISRRVIKPDKDKINTFKKIKTVNGPPVLSFLVAKVEQPRCISVKNILIILCFFFIQNQSCKTIYVYQIHLKG